MNKTNNTAHAGSPAERWLTCPQVAERLGLASVLDVAALVETGALPPPVRVAPDALRWRYGDVAACLGAGATDRYLMSKDVAKLLAISTRTLWRLLERGEAPVPIRYNCKLVRWLASDVYRYLAAHRQDGAA